MLTTEAPPVVQVTLPCDVDPNWRLPISTRTSPSVEGIHVGPYLGSRSFGQFTTMNITDGEVYRTDLLKEGRLRVYRGVLPGESFHRNRAKMLPGGPGVSIGEMILHMAASQSEWWDRWVRAGGIRVPRDIEDILSWKTLCDAGCHTMWFVAIRRTLPNGASRPYYFPEIELRR